LLRVHADRTGWELGGAPETHLTLKLVASVSVDRESPEVAGVSSDSQLFKFDDAIRLRLCAPSTISGSVPLRISGSRTL
jgi:hypothetical protein